VEIRQTSTAVTFSRSAGRFGIELMQMCAAMCLGGIVLNLAIFEVIALAGFPNFVQQHPETSMLILGIDWAIAMGTWMALRHHPWRHNLEMSSTSIVATGLFAIASWMGWFTPETTLGWFTLFTPMCGPTCLLMAADMLFRYKHYTSQSDAHDQAH